jgi:hypothetical protein
VAAVGMSYRFRLAHSSATDFLRDLTEKYNPNLISSATYFRKSLPRRVGRSPISVPADHIAPRGVRECSIPVHHSRRGCS